LRLKRGYLILIAGGAIVAVGLGLFAYSTITFASSLLNENRYALEPSGSHVITRFISNTSGGAYLVAFPEPGGRIGIMLASPSNVTLADHSVLLAPADQPVYETFQAVETGDYSLILTNLSTADAMSISAILGDVQSIGFPVSSVAVTAIILFIAGIAATAAGAIITVLDRRRITKMKQFGDTSDLV
jgi:hypothetical protein